MNKHLKTYTFGIFYYLCLQVFKGGGCQRLAENSTKNKYFFAFPFQIVSPTWHGTEAVSRLPEKEILPECPVPSVRVVDLDGSASVLLRLPPYHHHPPPNLHASGVRPLVLK